MKSINANSNQIQFFFLQLEAGYEKKFMSTHLGSLPTWKGIGKYDIICAENPSQKHSFAKTEIGKGVLDIEQICCFSFPRINARSPFDWLKETARKELWLAFCLIKTNPSCFIGKKTIEPFVSLQNVAKRIKRKISNSYILGAFGWHDIVVLLRGDNITQITEDIVNMQKNDGNAGPILKTFSMFGINSKFLLNDKDIQDKLNKEKDNIKARVYLTCKNYPTLKVYSDIRALKQWEDATVAFGAHDITVDTTRPLGDAISNLIALRHKFKNSIYSTATVLENNNVVADSSPETVKEYFLDKEIEKALPSRAGSLKAGFNLSKIFNKPKDGKSGFLSFVDVKRQADQLNMILRSSLSNSLTREAYIDMLPCMLWLKKKPMQKSQIAKVVLDYASLAYQQRSLGTMGTLWNVGNPTPLFYRGGIQRSLWAAEYICWSLLKRHGIEWNGFVVFGQAREYLRTHLGIINLPYRSMFEPSEWWGLFHEIGHECVYQRLIKMGDKFGSLLSELYHIPKYDIENKNAQLRDARRLYYKGLFWEITSDIFDLEFGFNRDWNLYRDTLLPYLVQFPWKTCFEDRMVGGKKKKSANNIPVFAEGSYEKDRFDYYFMRILAVYWWYQIFQKKTNSTTIILKSFLADIRQPLLKNVENLIDMLPKRDGNEFRTKIKKMLKLNTFESLARKYMLEELFNSEVGNKLLSLALPKPKRGGQTKLNNLSGIMKKLYNGEPVTRIQKPEQIICELIRNKKVDEKTNIATLLSFWNEYAKVLPERIRKSLK